ncbi:hypothetical protein [Actinokineospora bangkokensis]|uniref:Uncharacterized protein n=1 Tax=Actinokineospora bangkokensis TaxID=1193682 RepID=A0A1Q9LEW1_9PSEU|nr:hypothetical protein [Actinokineospora bangkokensis]OLR90555.1 hypothetical protein BJP25_28440 [Actinokineospora bangkokensis]
MGLIALIVVIVAVVAVLGNLGYLSLLKSAAAKRGMSGSAVAQYVNGKMPQAWLTTAGAAVAALLSLGGTFPDVLAVILGGASAAVAGSSLNKTMERYRSQS